MANFDLLEAQIQPKRVKVPMVVDKNCCVQVIGRKEIEGPANLAFADGRFESCGEKVKVELVPGARHPEWLSSTVIPGKVMNTGVVYADLIITSMTGVKLTSKANIPILWHDLLPSPGAEPACTVQAHDFQIEGFENVSGYCDCDNKLRLLLAVVVRYCIVVASERILRVEAAETFC